MKMNTTGKMATDPTASVLEELTSLRDPKVLAMFEIYEERGWFRNLFTTNERWLEAHWIDDDHIQLDLVSRRPSSAIPSSWRTNGESKWIVPMKERGALAEWINTEWLQIRGSEKMRLKMWND